MRVAVRATHNVAREWTKGWGVAERNVKFSAPFGERSDRDQCAPVDANYGGSS
jgi:hypothetical protein